MGKTYTSTLSVSWLKEHTCSSCQNVYAYPFKRKIKGTSTRSAEHAQGVLQKRVASAMTSADVDPVPCPSCGTVQAEMIGQRRSRGHKFVFWLLIALPAATLLILKATDTLNANTAAWVLAAVAAAAALATLAIEFANPNRDLDANRARSAARVESGEMRSAAAKQAGRRPGPSSFLAQGGPGRPALANLMLLLVVLAVPLAAAPELWRASRHWPLNPECYPPVVGLGDSTRVYMPERITSIQGKWRGKVTAAFRPAGDAAADPIPVPATTNQDDWGSTISAKEDEKNTNNHPHVELTAPDAPSLAGKAVDALVHLDVEFPAVTGSGNTFAVQQATMDHTFPIRLAPAGAGRQYKSLWWECSLGAIGLLLLGSLMLIAAANALRKPGTVSNVYPLSPNPDRMPVA